MNKLNLFNQNQIKELDGDKKFPEIRPGYTIRVHQKVKEGDKQRIQVFEGLVIAKKHGRGINGTITVRKITHGVGVERVYPLHLPSIEKIEVIKRGKVRRAKLYYIRSKAAKEARLKELPKKKEEKEPEPKPEPKPKTKIKKKKKSIKKSATKKIKSEKKEEEKEKQEKK